MVVVTDHWSESVQKKIEKESELFPEILLQKLSNRGKRFHGSHVSKGSESLKYLRRTLLGIVSSFAPLFSLARKF